MWQEQDSKVTRNLTFADFSETFAFMTRVALIALPGVVSSPPFYGQLLWV